MYDCKNRCGNKVHIRGTSCATCWKRRKQPRQSKFPLQQGSRDIKRYGQSLGMSKGYSFEAPERDKIVFDFGDRGRRAQSEERDLPVKRKASTSPQRDEPKGGKKKRRLDDEPILLLSPPPPTRTELPLLFIPFEGNFNPRIVGGFERKGTQTSQVSEHGGNAIVIQGKKKIKDGTMESTFGTTGFWKGRKGEIEKVDLLADNKKGFLELLDKEDLSAQDFYERVVTDRLRCLQFTEQSTPEQGLPEVIVLSERLLEWPKRLFVLNNLYRRAAILGTGNLQDMAAYVHASTSCYSFSTLTRRAGKNDTGPTETWLVVHKNSVYPPCTVACVHLSSKYTSVDTGSMDWIVEALFRFAKRHQIQAIVGDFNLNTFSIHGGAFSISNDFVRKGGTVSLRSTFGTSSGAGDKAYMGGMICDERMSFRPTLTTFGNCAIPPWFRTGDFSDLVFSDHHSLYCRYAFYGQGGGGFKIPPPREGRGGDCFFDTLARRLDNGESSRDLRRRIIDQISPTVIHNRNMQGPRSVLVQQEGSGLAVPVWCDDVEEFMAQMRRSRRWVDDSLLPYIAHAIGRRIMVQYANYHAVIGTDGLRRDEEGVAIPEEDDIFMYCEGNHFW